MDSEEKQKTSEKKDNGAIGAIRSHTPQILQDNAPRVVAGIKMLASSVAVFSKNKLFSITGIGLTAANVIVFAFGNKKSEAEKEKLREEEEKDAGKPKSGVGQHIYKVLHPSKYPLESGSSIAVLSSGFWAASGLFGNGGFSAGRLVGGALSIASDANIALTKEKIGDPQANHHPEGSVDYYLTEMKNRPVLLSSLLNLGSDVAMVIGGAHEFRKGREINTLLMGTALLTANLFQAIFVNKNDYNIEKKEIFTESKNHSENIENQANPSWQGRTKKSDLLYSHSI